MVSGSGDSDIKIWDILPHGDLQHLRSFSNLAGAVFSLGVRDSLLYAGLQDGEIDVWDLETGSCIRSIHAHEADVLSLTVLGGDVYTAAGDGRVLRVNEAFDCTAAFKAHQGIVASSIVIDGEAGKWDLITAGDDSYVKVGLQFTLGRTSSECTDGADLDRRYAGHDQERRGRRRGRRGCDAVCARQVGLDTNRERRRTSREVSMAGHELSWCIVAEQQLPTRSASLAQDPFAAWCTGGAGETLLLSSDHPLTGLAVD